ncbi:GNAT family N-acetyltransferase [Xanthovirga aplysinae]|uniref:GNAT family N-acetyltransferase n=1 Tax=Xanthovirga aplysinae TaxID=2529853 RepID=UPI0012BBE324|nr:GNAT family N-acetyltransferase [Xanthovirga aplysinae]MTI29772.1 GNAT family N-acetyltransferase [Xanthovirga aplysinae]
MIKAEIKDKPRVVEILSNSFKANKSVNYVVKQDSKVDRRINRLMEYSFDMCNAFGEIWMDNEKNGCALILWSDQKRMVPLWDAKLAFGSIGITRAFKVLKREAFIKQNHPNEPFCYLWFIGVDPKIQRKGIGGKLIKEVLKVCDKKNLSIYLETSTLTNIPWYQKNGFEIFEKIDLGYELFLLKRDKGIDQ